MEGAWAVALAELPPEVKADIDLLAGCVSGAMEIGSIEKLMAAVGFAEVAVTLKGASRELINEWFPGRRIEEFIASATIQGTKPTTSTNQFK